MKRLKGHINMMMLRSLDVPFMYMEREHDKREKLHKIFD